VLRKHNAASMHDAFRHSDCGRAGARAPRQRRVRCGLHCAARAGRGAQRWGTRGRSLHVRASRRLLRSTLTVAPPHDPTARFSFYYLDYTPPSAVPYAQILGVATPIPEASGDNAIWLSCTCDDDAGVICPDAGSRAGQCGLTHFTWNTASVPAGAYWVLALNNDPPYQVYTVSGGPVRVAHGGAPFPPASAVVLPDGLFAADLVSRTLWVSTGQAPLHFNVFDGIDDATHALDPPKALGAAVTPIKNVDGTYSYDWDLSSYSDGLYYFGVEVSDATGQKSSARSWLGQNVYHPPKDGGLSEGGKDAAADHDASSSDGASYADADAPSPALDAAIDRKDAANPADGEADSPSSSDAATESSASGSNATDSGGCGCRTSGHPSDARAVALIALLVATMRRRRASRRPRRLAHQRCRCLRKRQDFRSALESPSDGRIRGWLDPRP